MGCNCKWLEVIVAVVILIVTIWPTIIGTAASWWVVVIAAALLLLHALKCKNCGACATDMDKPAKKKKR